MTPEQFEELEAMIAARKKAIAAFVAAHPGASFSGAPKATSGLALIVVSPSCHVRGGWRLTRIDRRGPSGHTEFETHAEAVREAAREYGVDLATVTISGVREFHDAALAAASRVRGLTDAQRAVVLSVADGDDVSGGEDVEPQ